MSQPMHEIGDTAFDFADLCDEAVQRCGGETATAEDIQKIRRSVRIILERWAALRYNTWRISTITVGAGGTTQVKLPKKVDDIITITVANDPKDPTGSQAAMARIGPNEYGQLTTKETKGQPTQWYLNRTIRGPELFVYPTGRQNQTEVLTLQFVERPASYDIYGSDVDAPGRWLEALITTVAWDLARKRPRADGTFDDNLITRLKADADEATLIAQNADRSRHRYQFRMGGRRR